MFGSIFETLKKTFSPSDSDMASIIGKEIADGTFDITFQDESLGLIFEENEGKVIVQNVMNGYSAHSKGIRSGDIIIAVEGTLVSDFDSFGAIIGKYKNKRPLIIR